MKRICMLLAAIFLMAAGALAQMPEPPFPPPPGAAGGVMFFQKGPGAPSIVTANTYNYVYTTNVGEREAVKGAPYSATAVIESTQVLADGNRIVNKSSTFLARDGEGRTRREMPKALGPLPVDMPQMVMISDPVSKTDYMLNPKEKTADVIKRMEGKGVYIRKFVGSGTGSGTEIQTGSVETERKTKVKMEAEQAAGAFHVSTGGGAFHVEQVGGEARHEDLGAQVIEGVSCAGTRETRTIAAGAIGNEQPIEITSETWTSPELKTVVLSKHNDPRFGQTVYQLTDIKRSEPDQSLFQVPSDYRILSEDVVGSPKQ